MVRPSILLFAYSFSKAWFYHPFLRQLKNTKPDPANVEVVRGQVSCHGSRIVQRPSPIIRPGRCLTACKTKEWNTRLRLRGIETCLGLAPERCLAGQANPWLGLDHVQKLEKLGLLDKNKRQKGFFKVRVGFVVKFIQYIKSTYKVHCVQWM